MDPDAAEKLREILASYKALIDSHRRAFADAAADAQAPPPRHARTPTAADDSGRSAGTGSGRFHPAREAPLSAAAWAEGAATTNAGAGGFALGHGGHALRYASVGAVAAAAPTAAVARRAGLRNALCAKPVSRATPSFIVPPLHTCRVGGAGRRPHIFCAACAGETRPGTVPAIPQTVPRAVFRR